MYKSCILGEIITPKRAKPKPGTDRPSLGKCCHVLDVLRKILIQKEEEPNTNTEDSSCIFNFFFTKPNAGTDSPSLGKCCRVLDVCRKSLIQKEEEHKTFAIDDVIIRSATELNEAGIRFRESETSSLKDISFISGVLKLPVIVVDDATESTFLNIISFERFHAGAGNQITSYIAFMDNLIDTERDVALLNKCKIILNAIGSDKAVAKLFNSLSKDITFDSDNSLKLVRKKVNDHCKRPLNRWRATLIQTYFRNPWAILSLFAAILLFALTIAQTIYTIYPYYHPLPDNSPPSPLISPNHTSPLN